MTATDLTTRNFDSFVKSNERVLVDFYDPSDAQWPQGTLELQNAIRQARGYGSTVEIGKVNINAEPALTKKWVPNGPFPHLLWFQHGELTQYHRHLRQAKHITDFILALDRNATQEFRSEEEVRESVNRAVWAQLPRGSKEHKVLEVVASKHLATTQFAWRDAKTVQIKWLEEGEHDNGIFEGEVTVENLDKWVRANLLKSEPLPEPQAGDSVPVVGQNFEEIVLREDKDVFLLVYASWCGFSRRFLKTWEALARRVRSVSSLVVAKMDGDRNSSPFPEDFAWHAYPTVFFVKAGSRKPNVFHGNRTEARLLDFIKENGSRPMAEELASVLQLTPTTQTELVGTDNENDWEL